MNRKEQIIKILTELRPEFDFTQEGVDFFEAGMLDSFDLVALVSDLDKTFGISISPRTSPRWMESALCSKRTGLNRSTWISSSNIRR